MLDETLMGGTILPVGLDFEASGSDPWEKHVPIEIGLAVPSPRGTGVVSANWRIGGWRWSDWDWSDEAFGVHGITQKDLERQRPVWEVDIQAAKWLLDEIALRQQVAGQRPGRMWTIPVGWNVAGYDRQFISRWFPNLNRLLSYRTIDLGALVFAASKGDIKEYQAIKKAAKGEASASALDSGDWVSEQWHNAEYDAYTSLHAFEYLLRY